MAIVVEVLNRSGHVISTHKFESERVTVGRGLNVDLTLQDPHIDAKHCVFERQPDTHNLYCEDLASLNGVFLLVSRKPGYGITFKNKAPLTAKRLFYSGQQFLLGRTVVRVYDADHPVVAPLPMSPWEDVGHGLSHWAVWLSAIVAILFCQSLDAYLGDPTQENLLQYVLPSGYAVIGALAFAGVWAFIGRNLRHEGRFATHFSIALLAILASTLANWLLPFLVYNFRLWWAENTISTLITALLVFVVGLLTLLYATHLKPVIRAWVALILPIALILSMIIGAITQPEFRPTPAYETALVAPRWQLRGSISQQQYLDQAFEVFDNAQVNGSEE